MVETITLDALKTCLDNNIDFIKVDVEGFEAVVFRGGISLLSGSDAPDILFESVYCA